MSRTPNTLENRAIRRFLVLPFILLVSIYVISAVVEQLFGIPAAATYIFAGIGGIGWLAYYYRHWIKRIMMR